MSWRFLPSPAGLQDLDHPAPGLSCSAAAGSEVEVTAAARRVSERQLHADPLAQWHHRPAPWAHF